MKVLFYISKKNTTKLITNAYTANIIHIGEPTFTNMSKENIEKKKTIKKFYSFFRMNYLELICSWNISDIESSCSCWVIAPLQETTLHPDVVNEIILPYEGHAATPLLQVNNHMCDKPWRVISEYIYFNERTHSLTVPVVATFRRTLGAGEPLCHVRVMDPIHSLQNIKGKFI
jgi:hypothetical protein